MEFYETFIRQTSVPPLLFTMVSLWLGLIIKRETVGLQMSRFLICHVTLKKFQDSKKIYISRSLINILHNTIISYHEKDIQKIETTRYIERLIIL